MRMVRRHDRRRGHARRVGRVVGGVRTAIGIARRRPMGAKAVELALFALQSDDSRMFAEDMRRWNAEEGWKYKDVRNFRTAGLAAIDNLNRPAAGCRVPTPGADSPEDE